MLKIATGALEVTSKQSENAGSTTLFGMERKYLLALSVIFMLGALLRFYNLGRDSLWLDEVMSYQIASKPGLTEVYNAALLDNHPPLHYLILHIMTYFGNSEFILRLPSAFFGILTIPVAYKLGEHYFGSGEGLIAAFLLAISHFHIRFSQEARMYAMLAFFSALSLYFFSRAVNENKNILWTGFALSTILDIYSHYFAMLLMFSYTAYITITKLRIDSNVNINPQLKKFLLCIIVIAIISLPLAFGFYTTVVNKTSSAGEKFGVKPSLEFLPMIFGSLSSGYSNLPFFIILFAAGLISSWSRNKKDTTLLSTWIFIPCILSIGIASMIFFQLRYMIFLLTAYLAVVSCGVTSLSKLAIGFTETREIKGKRRAEAGIETKESKQKKLLLANLFILVIIISTSYSSLADYYLYLNREDWRGVASYLKEQSREGDVIVSLLLSHNIPFQYYYNAEGREFIQPVNYTVSELENMTSENKTTWYIIHKDTAMVDQNLEMSNWISANAKPEFLSPYIRIYAHRAS